MLKNTGKLAGKTLFITGASRGIGKTIALKAAQDGANIVICAKTAEPHPKLPGTIYTVATEVEQAGGKALPCVMDVRFETQVSVAVDEAVKTFGGIDIVINNASAISLTPTNSTDMKRYDLMNQVNSRGTFLVSKTCLPHLLKSKNPHILNLSPPLNLNPRWFSSHLAYTMAKYGMSFSVLGMSEEFKDDGIAVNALWPRTAIHTAAIEMLTGKESWNYSRKPEIVADAAYAIITKDSRSFTGKFMIDDMVLKEEGITDLTPYACNPEYKDRLILDLFLDEDIPQQSDKSPSENKSTGDRNVEVLFKAIEANISPELVKNIGAIYQFNMTGAQKGTWFLDLKNGNGGFGKGTSNTPADVTLTMESANFFDIFTGKMKPATAFLMGKMKIDGNLHIAMKLEKLMTSLRAKM
ncbi:hydroxysteroid dehydrogenase-like protein 2 [Fopius arisanus]|uniref:Hydroxysteroid dehydrogenase-like protein 2 n=1 Tax=Fopius arisanus TaxID=64838 RepID=A0A9R1U4T3_9HYME|nr:PREDICTED: hydroxysteroid dehydrogenase-like protein 2 [Fopius arisanus]